MTQAKNKKTFNFILSSSAPYSYQNDYDAPSGQVDLTKQNNFSASYVDMLKVGMNAVSSRQSNRYSIGLDNGFLKKYTQNYIDAYREPEQYGYGLSIVNLQGPNRFVTSGDRLSLNDIFGQEPQNAPFVTTPSRLPGTVGNLTEKYREKTDFGICPPPGPTGDITKQRVLNSPTWWTNKDQWKSFVLDNFNDKLFYDLDFTMDSPYLLGDIIDGASANHTREVYVDIKPSYNFYVKEYEEGLEEYDTTSVSPLPAYALPSIYMFVSELDESYLDPKTPGSVGPSEFYKHITLNDKIKGTFQDILSTMSDGGVRKVGEKDRGQHFQKFGNLLKYKSGQVRDSLVQMSEYKNLAFSSNNLDLIGKHKGKEVLFPMNVNIEFSTDLNTVFADLLKDTNLASSLIKYISNNPQDGQEISSQYDFHDWCEYDNAGICQPSESRVLEESNYKKNKMWDFSSWLESQAPDTLLNPEPLEESAKDERISKLNKYLGRLKEVLKSLETSSYSDTEIYYTENIATVGEIILSVPAGEKITAEVIENKGREYKSELESLRSNTLVSPVSSISKDYDYPVFLGKINEEKLLTLGTIDPEYSLYSMIMRLLLKTKADEVVKENFRGFIDLLRNNLNTVQGGKKAAHSETLLYCVEKISGVESLDGEFTWGDDRQYIWFPNSSEVDVIEYVDTQVKYNTAYRYVIKAYQLVIGNKYQYKVNDGQTIDGKMYASTNNDLWASICLFNSPCAKIIEVPFYDSSWDSPRGIKVVDAPPMPPEVQIIPYKGVSDKLTIWLNGTSGESWLPDIQIFPNEFDRTGLQTNKNSEIYFKSDDPVGRFEIFRLSKPPKKYSDFAEGVRTNLGTNTRPENSFIDKVTPNKKYYYTFRSVDIHGKTSNPSVVYECELIMQREFVYPSVKIYDMQSIEAQITKPFQRHLELLVSPQQTTLNTAPLKELADLLEKGQVVGPVTEDILTDIQKKIEFINPGQSVWNANGMNKKYKIRINSKKSSRKIDFNIDFNNSGIVSDETDQE